MPMDEVEPTDGSDTSPADNDVPALEDAYEPEAATPEVPSEDEPTLLDPSARALEGDVSESDALSGASSDTDMPIMASVGDDDEREDAGDADTISDEPEEPVAPGADTTVLDWGRETSARRIAVELKHLERDVRTLLEGRDSRRKRRLSGTRRWLDLEEDILSWHGTSRLDQESLSRLEQLISKRHHLFRRLHFLAGTRPRWNS